jgi:hypothetical protein
MLSKLGHIWFSSATARLTRLGRPGGLETRWWLYMVCAGDGYKVKRYKGEVLITLVSVLDVMPLVIIRAVACVYSK